MADVQALIDAFRSDPDGPNPAAMLPELVDGGFVIPDDATVTTGVMQIDPVDSVSGAVRQFYIFGDGVFKYDATDETTAHDGISCLVLIGGRRYKLLGDIRVKAVEAVGIDAEPTPSAYGQAWVDLTGVVGDSNQIIIWTSRGWVAQDPDYGPPIYVKTATTDYPAKSYVHWDETDGWVSGFGPSQYQADTIPLSADIWDGRVQNQTTNTQPATISKGIAHIIGPLPTGTKWAGNAGKLSISETDDDVTIYTPYVGQTVYDIALGIEVKWNGTAWEAVAGVWIDHDSVKTTSGNCTDNTSGTGYTFLSGTPPTTSNERKIDNSTLTVRARRANAKLRFIYTGAITSIGSITAWGIFRDSESTAIDFGAILNGQLSIVFEVDAPDADPHVYTMCIFFSTAASIPNDPQKRLFSAEVGS